MRGRLRVEAIDGPDVPHLARQLQALANPVRLRMMGVLQRACPVAEIALPPERARTAGAGPMSSVAIRKHLAVLTDEGLVKPRRLLRDGRVVDHFQVNATQVFALLEGLRSMGTPADDLAPLDVTLAGPPARTNVPWTEPHLVLVRGMHEGTRFRLGQDVGAATVIGRGAGAGVRLEYDAYLSRAAASVERTRRGFDVRDLGSRNGTTINWERIPAHQPRSVRPGDVIGVGRSLLLFRDG